MSRSKEKKFSIGDPVKFREGITNESMGTMNPRLDLKKVYHISFIESDGVLHLSEAPSFVFSAQWLEPAEDEPKDEPKTLGEQVNSAFEGLLRDMVVGRKTHISPGDYVVVLKEDIRSFGREINSPEKSGWVDLLPDKPVKVDKAFGPVVILEGFPTIYLHENWVRLADKVEVREKALGIKDVIFSGPATIVLFTDGTKEVVKCDPKDRFDSEKGIALACARKLMGGDGYYAAIRGFVKKWEKDDNFDDMSTEGIRQAVWAGCEKYPIPCSDKCPCSHSKTKTCVSISTATRKELIAMLKAFRDNGDWRR